MRAAGLDIGSRSAKLVVLEQGNIAHQASADTGCEPVRTAEALLGDHPWDRLLATGYGRTLMEVHFEARTVTEIKAHGRGVRELFPDAGTILDIGGQDSKAISLDRRGKVGKFEMNDRCAAGTGKFLEMMAASLGFRLEEFGKRAQEAESEERINSMCAVFAESEVTSAIAGGADRRAIALGLHRAVIRRAAGMLKRVSTAPEVVFTGGVATNPCLAHMLREHLECAVRVPDDPRMTGALGAALLAAE